MIFMKHSAVKTTIKKSSIRSRAALVAFESPLGNGVDAPSATQFKQMVIRMNHSNGFHSTMSRHNFLIGFLRPKQKSARFGLSGGLAPGFLIGLRGIRSFTGTGTSGAPGMPGAPGNPGAPGKPGPIR